MTFFVHVAGVLTAHEGGRRGCGGEQRRVPAPPGWEDERISAGCGLPIALVSSPLENPIREHGPKGEGLKGPRGSRLE